MPLFRNKERTDVPNAPPASTAGGNVGDTFLPHRAKRPRVESLFMRVIATGGVIGIGTALAAILGSQDVAAWIIGIVVSGVTVILAAVLWSSRTL